MRRSISLIPLGLVALLTACDSAGDKRIQLADAPPATARATSWAQNVRVQADEQRTLAILDFDNETGDEGLDWLRRGLSDMLVTELSQSPYLKVLGAADVDHTLGGAGRAAADLNDDAVAAQVASEAGIEAFLCGRFSAVDEQLVIDAELRDIGSGKTIRREQVRGPLNLQRVFSMVSDLSRQMRSDLRGTLEAARHRGLRVSEMTDSVEAFRHYSRGLENLNRLIYAEADYDFGRALEADPDFAAAHLRLAESRVRLGQLRSFVEHLADARRLSERLSRADELRLRLFEADVADDAARVAELTEEVLRLAPDDIEMRLLAANMFFNRQDYERALVEYEAILEEAPERAIVYNQLGYLHAHRGEFEAGIRYLRRYQELTPDEPNAFDSMGEVLMMAGRLDEASEQFERALTRWPQFFNSMANLTRLHAELDDLERSLEYADRWRQAAPNAKMQAEARVHRGAILWRFGRLEEAERAFVEARELDSGAIEPYRLASAMHRAEGNTQELAELQDECYARHGEALTSGDVEIGEVGRFLGFCLDSGVTSQALLEAAASVESPAKSFGERDRVTLYRGVLAMRAGDAEASREFLAGAGADVVDKLIGGWHVQRGHVWKYVVEAIQRAPDAVAAEAIVARGMKAAEASPKKGHQVLARLLDMQLRERRGEEAAVAAGFADLGIARDADWLVIGPFRNRDGFRRRFPPEVDASPARSARRRDGRELTWRSAGDGTADGWVDLAAVLGENVWSVGYAQTVIESPDERVVQIRLGADEATKLWVNDEQVWQSYRTYAVDIDFDIVKVTLRPGPNRLLLKVGNTLGDWGFYLRVTDDEGEGMPDFRFRSPVPQTAELR